jgi:hypothetical protein
MRIHNLKHEGFYTPVLLDGILLEERNLTNQMVASFRLHERRLKYCDVNII